MGREHEKVDLWLAVPWKALPEQFWAMRPIFPNVVGFLNIISLGSYLEKRLDPEPALSHSVQQGAEEPWGGWSGKLPCDLEFTTGPCLLQQQTFDLLLHG
jgi:hypothetical protein